VHVYVSENRHGHGNKHEHEHVHVHVNEHEMCMDRTCTEHGHENVRIWLCSPVKYMYTRYGHGHEY
jgi:ABC-type Zn2+ transport system substrate-binding protein/surface adhesin